MRENLLGDNVTEEPVTLRLYCDEIKPYRNRAGQQWMYLGIVAIPEHHYDHALRDLQADRRACDYQGEVHFTNLTNFSYAHDYNEKTKLARRWAKRVIYDADKVYHFYLLGLNLDNLQEKAFGKGGHKQKRNIYNRFFRASIDGMLRYFFPEESVVVSRIFHDKSELEADDYFDWHAIWRLQNEKNWLTFGTDVIVFIDSDHREEPQLPNDSHFIQLCDVLMGGFTQCLDGRTTKDGCCEIADLLRPLAERLVDKWQVHNKKSRYYHYRRISLSFFPSGKLSLDDLNDQQARARSSYYVERPLVTVDQLPLFKD